MTWLWLSWMCTARLLTHFVSIVPLLLLCLWRFCDLLAS